MLATGLCGVGAHAEPAPPARVADTCVEAEVDGGRVQSFSCLTQKLTPTQAPRAAAPAAPNAAEAITARPANQLGVFNHAALGNRMGNTFGTSVLPQRPNVPPPASPLVPTRP